MWADLLRFSIDMTLVRCKAARADEVKEFNPERKHHVTQIH